MAFVSYVTVDEADAYIVSHYSSTDALRLNWNALSVADKEVYLQKSYDAINQLPFRGRKTSKGQHGAFPRYPSTIVPDEVKGAQVENAVAMTDKEVEADETFYKKMWKYGVESYSIGNLSEKSSNGSWGVGSSSGADTLASTQASKLLQSWLTGGFDIE